MESSLIEEQTNLNNLENLNKNAAKESSQDQIEAIDSFLDSDIHQRLMKSGRFDSKQDLLRFTLAQGAPYGQQHDYPVLLDGTEFIIPNLSDTNFGDNLYFNEYRDTVGLLCQLGTNPDSKVLVFVSSFYWSVCDFEGNWQKGEIIGKGMQGVSQKIKDIRYQGSRKETSKERIRKLCELAGGLKFRVGMGRVYHNNSEGKLTSTVIYKYYLVE